MNLTQDPQKNDMKISEKRNHFFVKDIDVNNTENKSNYNNIDNNNNNNNKNNIDNNNNNNNNNNNDNNIDNNKNNNKKIGR